MPITPAQLEQIVVTALPGERLREHVLLGKQRVRLTLVSGEALDLHMFADQPAAANAVQALRRLRGEIDLPIPALRASDPSGELAGVPCLIASPLEGVPLVEARGRMTEEQLHLLGQRIGDLAYRVHRLACSQYGLLAGNVTLPAQTTEPGYVMARMAIDLPAAQQAGLLSGEQATQVEEWFQQRFQPIGSGIALVTGSLELENLLVRQSREGWALSGVLGWERALGWCPAWDHTMFLESARDSHYFGLRVGYGKAYDELTARTYEQVREGALRPYRIVLALEQMLLAKERSERARHKRVLLAMLELG
jgi:Phosphotransferase enzyme family